MAGKTKRIERVVIKYEDGSVEEFTEKEFRRFTKDLILWAVDRTVRNIEKRGWAPRR